MPEPKYRDEIEELSLKYAYLDELLRKIDECYDADLKKYYAKKIYAVYGEELAGQLDGFFAGPKAEDDASVGAWAKKYYLAGRLCCHPAFLKLNVSELGDNESLLGPTEDSMHDAAEIMKMYFIRHNENAIYWGNEEHEQEPSEEAYMDRVREKIRSLTNERQNYQAHYSLNTAKDQIKQYSERSMPRNPVSDSRPDPDEIQEKLSDSARALSVRVYQQFFSRDKELMRTAELGNFIDNYSKASGEDAPMAEIAKGLEQILKYHDSLKDVLRHYAADENEIGKDLDFRQGQGFRASSVMAISEVLDQISTRMRGMHSTHPQYKSLHGIADYLTLCQQYHDGAAAVYSTAATNAGESIHYGSNLEAASKEQWLEKRREGAEDSRLARLMTLSKELAGRKKRWGDTEEFTKFREALERAARGGDLQELYDAASQYIHLKNPYSQNGKDRLAIAEEVTLLVPKLKASKRDLEPLFSQSGMKPAKPDPRNIERLLIQENGVNRAALFRAMAEQFAYRKEDLISKAAPEDRQEVREAYIKNMLTRFQNSETKSWLKFFGESRPSGRRSLEQLEAGIDEMVKLFSPVTDKVQNLTDKYAEFISKFEEDINGKNAKTPERFAELLKKKGNDVYFRTVGRKNMLSKLLKLKTEKEISLLRVDGLEFEKLEKEIGDKFFPENKPLTLEEFRKNWNMSAEEIRDNLMKPEPQAEADRPEVQQSAAENQPVPGAPSEGETRVQQPAAGNPSVAEASSEGETRVQQPTAENQPVPKAPSKDEPQVQPDVQKNTFALSELRDRALSIWINPNAKAEEIREAALDSLIVEKMVMKKKMDIDESLDITALRNEREKIAKDPIVEKMCEKPEQLREKMAAATSFGKSIILLNDRLVKAGNELKNEKIRGEEVSRRDQLPELSGEEAAAAGRKRSNSVRQKSDSQKRLG